MDPRMWEKIWKSTLYRCCSRNRHTGTHSWKVLKMHELSGEIDFSGEGWSTLTRALPCAGCTKVTSHRILVEQRAAQRYCRLTAFLRPIQLHCYLKMFLSIWHGIPFFVPFVQSNLGSKERNWRFSYFFFVCPAKWRLPHWTCRFFPVSQVLSRKTPSIRVTFLAHNQVGQPATVQSIGSLLGLRLRRRFPAFWHTGL